MESGESGQAMIYKLEGDERTPFACHADEASAYAAIAAIEAAEEAKELDEILSKMEAMIEDEEEEDEKQDSYSDYGEEVRNNAKRGIELNEQVNNSCATSVGKVRAQQLADGEPISVETIKRMYSYLSRAEQVYREEQDDPEACGNISYLLWGGLAGLAWSKNKLRELGELEEEKQEMIEDTMQEDEMPEEAKSYDLGDMVQFMMDDELCTGVVENIDEEADVYTVRKYAVAGEEYEPTDKIYNLSGEELMPMTEEDIEDGELEGEASMDEPKEMNEEEDMPKGRIMAKMREVKMEVVETEEEGKIGMIEGYASTYGNTDLGGDVVEKGAFTQTLKHKNNTVPLLLDHGYKTSDIAGIAYLNDDEKGLYLKAEMPLDIPEVANAYKKTKFMIERGGKMGLSIGYDTVKAMPGEDGTRRLKELSLHEVSITPFPMNTEAQIMAAKARKNAVTAKPKNVTRRKAVTLPQDDYQSLVDEIKQLITSFKESR